MENCVGESSEITGVAVNLASACTMSRIPLLMITMIQSCALYKK